MAKGENIFKRKDGRWEGRYIKERDENNKIRYGFCYGHSYREAKEKVTAARRNLSVIRSVPAHPSILEQRFSDFCETWFADNTGKWKPSSMAKYESMLKKYIIPSLGQYRVAELNTALVRQFSEELLIRLSAKTVRDILSFLNQIIRAIPSDAGKHITISYPKTVPQKLRVLSRQEQQTLVQYLNHEMDRYKFAVLLALFTGMRIGELCGLRWENFSENADQITVSSTVQRIKNFDPKPESKTLLQSGTPKSKCSIRTIPLPAQIQALCQMQRAENTKTFVITGTLQPADPRMLQRKFQKYAAECQIPDVHFHTLRHTFATRCVEVGCDLKTLSEVLGHSSITMTMNRYVHPSLEFKRQNLQKLEEAGFFCAVKSAVSTGKIPQ